MNTITSKKLKIYNTLSKRFEEFKTLRSGIVRGYVCGPTVYDSTHVGHARTYVFFDIFRRYLEYLGYEVRMVINFTDIDDKIINRAKQEWGTYIADKWYEIPKKYIREFFEICEQLHLKPAYAYPKVTDHVQDMINFIDKLLKNEYAYVSEDGSVYFSIDKVKEFYGKLSGQKIDELIAGARVEPEVGKKNPLDFALWKSWKEGEPWWSSPWSPGRPGWHLECVVMASKYLDIPLDFHGGGQDLIFPHHENENAIAKAIFGIDNFANYWIHVGLVTIRGEKMSKSLGNIITVKEVLEKFDGEVLRLYYASTHYRKPLDFTFEGLEQAEALLKSLYLAYDYARQALNEAKDEEGELDYEVLGKVKEIEESFNQDMLSDLNTASALTSVVDLSKYITSKLIYIPEKVSKKAISTLLNIYIKLCNVLGILNKVEIDNTLVQIIELLLSVRSRLRSMKMYDLADEIRSRLSDLKIHLSDTKVKTYWTLDRFVKTKT